MLRLLPAAFAALLLCAYQAPAQDKTLTLTIKVGKADGKNVPVVVPLSLPEEWANFKTALVQAGDRMLVAQLTGPGLGTLDLRPSAPKLVRRDLHFVLPDAQAGNAAEAKVVFREDLVPAPAFQWENQPGEYAELRWLPKGTSAGIPVMRYMAKDFDDSSKEKRDKSYKVFHHLYNPEGKRFVTNGGQTNDNITDPKKLLFPHHRGLMYAFNRIRYGSELEKKADTWHATGDAHQSHEKYLNVEAGPVLGRHRVQVDWHGEKKEVFAREERELTVYKVPGGSLIDFASRLETRGGKVRLDGDPQHAGFQFRAHNDVAEKTAKETYFLRPDGKGKLGETRNWDPKSGKGPVDLPWDVLSFVLDGKRYSVAYLNNPTNPKDSRFSERDYGRFGCYFAYEITESNPLIVNYRIWLQDGEMSVEQARAMHDAFVNAPRATAK